MAQITDDKLMIVDSVESTHTETEILTDSLKNTEALYFAMGYLARNGKKFIEGIDKGGIYPNLTAGLANDLTGRVTATPEVFTYRPSAGKASIRDNSATIRRIKGNSIVWNQLIINGNFNSDGGWYKGNGLVTSEVSSNVLTAETSDKNYYNYDIRKNITSISGHRYILSCDMYSETFEQFRYTLSDESGDPISFFDFTNNKNNWVHCETIFTMNNIAKILRVGVWTNNVPLIGTFKIRNVNFFDLTQMFGTGNEPTTVEEFRALYPNKYYAYNSGELQDLNVNGIETVGFNQFNGVYAQVLPNNTYYLGGNYTSLGFTTELGRGLENITLPTSTEVVGDAPSDRLYTPSQAGYIYADGSNININLSHTGIRDGEYEPYKKVTHNLPISTITGGEPLRKAGSVYDEINETEYIKRVGVRPYAEGDENDATLLTDGTNTNYPLAEPIMTPITEVLDLNYYVEDFGTEKALLADNSAPFAADVVYQFNAIDTIRMNDINIERLTSIINELRYNASFSRLSVDTLFAGVLSIMTSIAPNSNNTIDMGSALARWATIYANKLSLGGSQSTVLLGDGSTKALDAITTKLYELKGEE